MYMCMYMCLCRRKSTISYRKTCKSCLYRYKLTSMRVTHSAWDLVWCCGCICCPKGRKLDTFGKTLSSIMCLTTSSTFHDFMHSSQTALVDDILRALPARQDRRQLTVTGYIDMVRKCSVCAVYCNTLTACMVGPMLWPILDCMFTSKFVLHVR